MSSRVRPDCTVGRVLVGRSEARGKIGRGEELSWVGRCTEDCARVGERAGEG